MKRAVIVQGLGFGDEGKGATVDFLVRELSADLVVRFCGGSQAGHNVELPDGRRHAFAQFGAGTFAGAATYLGEQMIINPPAMHAEAEHLRELTGEDPFQSLSIHPRALVSTVYHQQLNRLRELSRGPNRHGSCGHGIGETRQYWLRCGRDAIYVADLQDREALEGKLELLRQRALIEAQDFIDRVPQDEQWRLELLMESTAPVARELVSLGELLTLQPSPPTSTTAIFEGAQGVLLDEWRGFHPYTTWSTVTLHHALAMAEQSGADELCILGITRAYLTRHGAGPFPTWSPELDSRLSDHGNPVNAWQGAMRRGWLDLMLLSYAADVAGAPLDGIVVNNLDELAGLSPRICTGYRSPHGEVVRRPISAAPNLAAQERLTAALAEAVPIYEESSPSAIVDRLAATLAPAAITSTGSTWQDRTLRDVRFRHRSPAEDDCRGASSYTVANEVTACLPLSSESP